MIKPRSCFKNNTFFAQTFHIYIFFLTLDLNNVRGLIKFINGNEIYFILTPSIPESTNSCIVFLFYKKRTEVFF